MRKSCVYQNYQGYHCANQKSLVILVVGQKIRKGSLRTRGRHVFLLDTFLAVIRSAEPHFLPVVVVWGSELLLFDVSSEHYNTQRQTLLLGQLQHTHAQSGCHTERSLVIPRPCNTLWCPLFRQTIANTRHAIQRTSAYSRVGDTFSALAEHTAECLPWILGHLGRALRCAAAAMTHRPIHARQIPPTGTTSDFSRRILQRVIRH